MKPRTKLAKMFARNLAVGLLENIEVTWQQEIVDLTNDEVELVQVELARLAKVINKTIDNDVLGTIGVSKEIYD